MRIDLIKILLAVLFTHNCLSLEIPRKNTVIFDEFAGVAADSLYVFVNSLNIKSIILKTEPEKISWLVGNPLISKLSGSGIKIFNDNSTGTAALMNLTIRKAYVSYENCADDDSLIRKIEFKAEGNIRLNGALLPLPVIDKSYSDVISRNDVNNIEDKNFDYARGVVPERDNWFYKSFIEPVIVVGTAAITVILLFTVRSQ